MMVMMTAMTPSEKASRRAGLETWWAIGRLVEFQYRSRIHGDGSVKLPCALSDTRSLPVVKARR
jgi:hypothetical protein